MNKACPLVFREAGNGVEVLIFEHPQAGFQFVKGTIEPEEALEAACVRELLEESGITGKVAETLGSWDSGFEGQVWGFCKMEYGADLPGTWEFETLDDGGLTFRFSWHRLNSEPNGYWHPLFLNALSEVRKRVAV